MMKHSFLALPLVLLVAACDMPPAPPSVAPGPALPDAASDTCGANAQAGLVGQNATALETTLIMDQVRIIRPGQPVTMDFREERINFELDSADTIVRVFCG